MHVYRAGGWVVAALLVGLGCGDKSDSTASGAELALFSKSLETKEKDCERYTKDLLARTQKRGDNKFVLCDSSRLKKDCESAIGLVNPFFTTFAGTVKKQCARFAFANKVCGFNTPKRKLSVSWNVGNSSQGIRGSAILSVSNTGEVALALSPENGRDTIYFLRASSVSSVSLTGVVDSIAPNPDDTSQVAFIAGLSNQLYLYDEIGTRVAKKI